MLTIDIIARPLFVIGIQIVPICSTGKVQIFKAGDLNWLLHVHTQCIYTRASELRRHCTEVYYYYLDYRITGNIGGL